MHVATAVIYWVIIALWLAVLATLCIAFVRNPRTFGTIRLLVGVLLLDTVRNIAENFYFGLYFGGVYGLLPASFAATLGHPAYLILPKVANVVAASVVLLVLTLRWLPLASKERAQAELEIQRRSDALVKESIERQRLFETSIDLILITDRQGRLVRVSPSAINAIGYTPDEMVGRLGGDFIFPGDLDDTRREMTLARRGRDIPNFSCRYVHKDGHTVPFAWSGVWSESDQRYYFIGRDMTERKVAEERLRQLALVDQLTGLPNRASLHMDLEAMLAGAGVRSVSLAKFDIDGFRNTNDTLGRLVGDALLKAAAERMRAADVEANMYRSGGNEFAMIIPGCGDAVVVSQILEQAQSRLREQFNIDGHIVFISASVGVAIAPTDGTNADELIANAGLALQEAKAAGRQARRLYVPQLRAKAQARRSLDLELRRACANGEFILHFQPQFWADDKTVSGAEALLRWHHPEKGLLAPGIFIDALAESAVAPEVGRWILTTACQFAADWRARKLPRIAVNLFPAQFRSGTLLWDVDHALSESGLPPEALELEITENIALDLGDSVLAPLERLRAKGVGIAFDDFGTGYASLSCLTRYPLNRIKIDRSFVQKIRPGCGPEETAIVRSIVAMAINLGLEVTAEGVESLEQSDFLRSIGCQELQGFLLSRPLAKDQFEKLLGTPAKQKSLPRFGAA
uniref:putative bifunctional diguanylate cyclase/phosphodiesterase n=1 Tax=Mesorhizobium sp. WSM4875 TaxID=3038539 RepID=UPI002417C7D8|nr:bifunctional diguanylate cyclase/phosphodiesterase [Mesorhizobium sp. WSM4875]WIE94721.1 bifunctional diguanylate cyclase/phosphodiesterase [Mesorhizobium sp. WSM4875]